MQLLAAQAQPMQPGPTGDLKHLYICIWMIAQSCLSLMDYDIILLHSDMAFSGVGNFV